jgi:hypothetical protein
MPPRARAGDPGALATLRERFGEIDWYHTQEFAPDLVTPGMFDLRPLVADTG